MDVRMPDGTIIRNVPDGTPKDQILAKYQKSLGAASPEPTDGGWDDKTPLPDMPPAASSAPAAAPPAKPDKPWSASTAGAKFAGVASKFAGLVPMAGGLMEQGIESAVTGRPMNWEKAAPKQTRFPGAPEDQYSPEALQQQTAQMERAKPVSEAVSAVYEHPSLLKEIPGKIRSAWQAKMSIGWNGDVGQSFDWGQAVGDAVIAVAGTVALGGGLLKVIGSRAVDSFTKQEIQMMNDLLKQGKKAEVDAILKKRVGEIRDNINDTQKVVDWRSEEARKAQQRHQDSMHERRQKHEASMNDLNRQIAEAEQGLNTKKANELKAIRDERAERELRSHEEQRQRQQELNDAHEASIRKANQELADAREAAEKLENAEKLKLTEAEQKKYRRRLSKYVTRSNSEAIAKTAGFPGADGKVVQGNPKDSLSSRIVAFFQGRMEEEQNKIKNNTIYKDLFGRIGELRNQGETWGSSQAGRELLAELRSDRWVQAHAGESDISTYMRNQIRRVVGLLEQEPRPIHNEEGETIKFPSVPVVGEEVTNVVSELNRTAWQLSETNPVRAGELRKLASRIEGGLRDFVGEEFMPREKWRALMEETNRLEQLPVSQAAIGRKGADFIAVDKRARKTDIEDVESVVFKGSDHINQLQSFMPPEQFAEFLDQHLANTFANMTSKELREAIKSNGKLSWIDHINQPALRGRIESYLVDLERQEGIYDHAAANATKLEESLANHESNLAKELQKITAAKEKTIAEAGKESRAAISQANVEATGKGKALTSAGKAERSNIKAEAAKRETALAAALAPEERAVAELRGARSAQRRAGTEAAHVEKTETRRLRQEGREVERRNTADKADIKLNTQIADNIERIIFSRNPEKNAARFKMWKDRLVSSGVMSESEAAELEQMMDQDAADYVNRKAAYRAQKRWNDIKRKMIGGAVGAVGLGGAVGLYETGKSFLDIPITRGSEATP